MKKQKFDNTVSLTVYSLKELAEHEGVSRSTVERNKSRYAEVRVFYGRFDEHGKRKSYIRFLPSDVTQALRASADPILAHIIRSNETEGEGLHVTETSNG